MASLAVRSRVEGKDPVVCTLVQVNRNRAWRQKLTLQTIPRCRGSVSFHSERACSDE